MAKKKTKKIAKKKVLFGYKIPVKSYCEHSEREDKQFGNWEESYSNSLNDTIKHTKEYPDVVSVHDFKPGEVAYVVWTEWSTGDSFGHADRSGTEVIGVFRNEADADVLRSHIESRAAYGSKDNGYNVQTPDGQIFESVLAPWDGYFESLDSCHVGMVTVE